ncbi:MAG: N-acetylneuraminate synthase family protein [Desulfomonilaceae bacterium]|jgi:sialic acid synthase SpsE
MKPFYIDRFLVAEDEPPIFLPDIGTFFNQDMEIARNLVKKLKTSGVQLIKGEILHDAAISSNNDTSETYLSRNRGVVKERYRDLIERKVVSLYEYELLFNYCKTEGMGFVLSVYDFVGAEFGKHIGASALKVASSNIVHQPLIEFVARLKLPMIIDTGKSTLEEIARAVNWAQDAGAEMIMIQHSPEAPPAPIENHNLRMISTLRKLFDYPIGLSDHHAGEEMLYAAIALGASAVEKGVCPDEHKADQDTYHAMPVSQVSEVVEKCRRIHMALGSGMRYLRRDRTKYTSRMGLVSAANLINGDRLTLSNVSFAFPAEGVPVEHWGIIEGWIIRHEIPAGKPIQWRDVKPPTS